MPNSFKKEEKNPCTFHLCRNATAWGRGNCAYAEEDAHHAFASVEMSAIFLHSLTHCRLELLLLHVSPSASLLALGVPPLTQTSSGLLQAYRKIFSLEEKQMRNRKKKIIFSKQDKEMRGSSCLPCLRELLCIQGLARVENDAVVSQRTHVELNLWLQDKCLH